MARQHAAILRDIADLGLDPHKPQKRITSSGRLSSTSMPVTPLVVPINDEEKAIVTKPGLVSLVEEVEEVVISPPPPPPIQIVVEEAHVESQELAQSEVESYVDDEEAKSRQKRRGRKNSN